MTELQRKYEALKEILKGYKKTAVAFSGGLDSTFLLKAAVDIPDSDVLAVTVNSPFNPGRELAAAVEFTVDNKINHKVVDFNPFEVEALRNNPINRCYICKKAIFENLINLAGDRVIIEGSNADDDNDFRPGKAALEELKIKSPLKEAGLTKAEISILSKELNLPTWKKPPLACLATRFPYDNPFTQEDLKRVEQAEQFLMESGFNQVRLRDHGNIARIEIPEADFSRLLEKETKDKINAYLKNLGYNFITLDIMGYRTGSMIVNK